MPKLGPKLSVVRHQSSQTNFLVQHWCTHFQFNIQIKWCVVLDNLTNLLDCLQSASLIVELLRFITLSDFKMNTAGPEISLLYCTYSGRQL